MKRIGRKIAQKTNTAILEARTQFTASLHSEAPAQSIAFAFAVGTFINLLPMPGADMLLGFALLKTFKRLQRAPILTAMAVWNGFLTTPLIASSGKVGSVFHITTPLPQQLQTEAWQMAQQFAIGNLSVALALSCLSFLFVYMGVYGYRKNHH
jgi:hypothetical protein